jgi:yeast amino acid transporter
MATLTAAAARAADDFSQTPLESKNKVGIIIGLCLITLFSNICGVTFYGRIERLVKLYKLFLMLGVFILMIIVRAGGTFWSGWCRRGQ